MMFENTKIQTSKGFLFFFYFPSDTVTNSGTSSHFQFSAESGILYFFYYNLDPQERRVLALAQVQRFATDP